MRKKLKKINTGDIVINTNYGKTTTHLITRTTANVAIAEKSGFRYHRDYNLTLKTCRTYGGKNKGTNKIKTNFE